MRDIKPLMAWAKANSEAKIVDRILVKLLPVLVKNGLTLTIDQLETQERLEVSEELYAQIQAVTEALVGQPYTK
jgi:hypothetical protein